jgi:hypothetical protein
MINYFDQKTFSEGSNNEATIIIPVLQHPFYLESTNNPQCTEATITTQLEQDTMRKMDNQHIPHLF